MNSSPTNNFPWDLIVNSFSGCLSKDEEVQLQQWISADPMNSKKYDQLQKLWEDGLADYAYFKLANEDKAWNALQKKLNITGAAMNSGLYDEQRKPRSIYRFVSIAALVLLLIGVGIWYTVIRNTATVYETAYNENRKINLADGSSILLQPQTKIRVAADYNKTNRTVKLISGEATFGIVHQGLKKFIVEMDVAKVEDIGTSFTIKRLNERISVVVESGKVAFIKKATKESRELTSGMRLNFNIQNDSFGNIVYDDAAMGKLLQFDNTPLSDVVDILQKVNGIKIEITDRNIMQKKLTANLSGVPYLTALKVICKSLNLEYAVKDSVYIFKAKDKTK